VQGNARPGQLLNMVAAAIGMALEDPATAVAAQEAAAAAAAAAEEAAWAANADVRDVAAVARARRVQEMDFPRRYTAMLQLLLVHGMSPVLLSSSN
jgi:hypothetical protein